MPDELPQCRPWSGRDLRLRGCELHSRPGFCNRIVWKCPPTPLGHIGWELWGRGARWSLHSPCGRAVASGRRWAAQERRCAFERCNACVGLRMWRVNVAPETSCARHRANCPLTGGLFSSGSACGVGVGAWVPNVTAAVPWIGPLAMSGPAGAKVVNRTSDLSVSPRRLPARPALVSGDGDGRRRIPWQSGPRTCDRR